MSLPVSSPQADAGSFRDPSGFLFREQGVLYRQVNQVYRGHYDHLMSSGFYEDLVRRKLRTPHEEVDQAAPHPDLAYCLIRPEELNFISYPYEWCFSQLKDAALTTLKIQKLALEHGMTLKDSSAYNIQFYKGRAVLIDTLSFERYQPGEPWTAYVLLCLSSDKTRIVEQAKQETTCKIISSLTCWSPGKPRSAIL